LKKEDGRMTRPRQPDHVRQLEIVGTAEAAEILGVERPRIGRWIKREVMPPTAAELSATPVWYRRDIEKMQPWVEAHRRTRYDHDDEFPVGCPRCGAPPGRPCVTRSGGQATTHMARIQEQEEVLV